MVQKSVDLNCSSKQRKPKGEQAEAIHSSSVSVQSLSPV